MSDECSCSSEYTFEPFCDPVPPTHYQFRYGPPQWMPGEQFSASMFVTGPVDCTVNDIPVKANARV